MSCGPPPSPSNGYILHHTSTLDGETAFIVCLDFNLTITCTHDGIWVPNSTEILCGTIDTGMQWVTEYFANSLSTVLNHMQEKLQVILY